MSGVNYYTKEGLQKLRDELKNMESVERPNISRQIAEARDKGDLSENAEYDAAKEAQGILEAKIAKLKEVIANARVVDESQLDDSKALILSYVEVKNKATGKKMTYQLVAPKESDLKKGKISVESPIGKGLLGKEVGDVAEIQVPQGEVEFEITNIHR